MNEKWCEWHVLIVEDSDDGRNVTVMHPDCEFTINVFGGVTQFSYYCQIQGEIDNCGFDTLLDGHGPGWYRARMRHYTIRGDTWSEIDCEYEVEELSPHSEVDITAAS